jgi:hypothetical protein
MDSVSVRNGPETPPGTSAWPNPSSPAQHSERVLKSASRTEKARQAKADRELVSERAFVQGIDRFLDGGPWEGPMTASALPKTAMT